MSEEELIARFHARYPNGLPKTGSAISITRNLVADMVHFLQAEYKAAGLDVDLALERDDSETDIRNLIVYIGNKTTLVPLVISPQVVRLKQRAFYVVPPSSRESLLKEIMTEVRVAAV